MRADDPSLWDLDIKIDANNFARSLATIPEDRVQFLKITKMQNRDLVITPMSQNQLANIEQSGRYCWEGRNHKDSGAYHLRIFDTQQPTQQGDVCIRVLPWFAGWGFGHIHFDNNKQGYCWAGRTIAKTTFEIAVSPGPLTELEAARLLKQ